MVYEFRFPDVGEGIHEGELVKWLVKEGDSVKEDQPIAEVETDKAIVEIPSPKTGTIVALKYREGETIRVGEVIVVIGEKGEAVTAPAAKTPATPPVSYFRSSSPSVHIAQQSPMPAGMVLATPHTRQLARDLGVDIAIVRGAGRGGRITDEDVKAAAGKTPPPRAAGVSSPQGTATAQSTAIPAGTTKVTFEKYGRVIRVPFKGVRKSIAEHMVESVSRAVQVTHMDEADVTGLAAVREKMKAVAENKMLKLTYLPFIIKAVIAALKAHPYVNASLDEEKQEIVLKKYYNLGIAVDTPDGLLVPVLKKADQYTIMDLARQLDTLAEHARNRELELDDFRGSSFSITNVGSIGGLHFTPIINYPDAAILGVGRISDRAVPVNGTVKSRRILPLSLSFDHRLIDGAQAARFTSDIIKHLEDPDLLLIDA